MKKIIKSKIAIALIVLTFAFASAQNSVSLSITGQTKVNGVGGKGTATDFVTDGSNLDSFSIGFKAVLDNVTASVSLNDSSDAGTGLKFDSAYIEVADLFDGILTVKFFDIGYGVGVDSLIRPDLGSHGVKFTIKPIDMLSIGLGYGINGGTFYNVVANSTNSRTNANIDYHAIQLDVGINNAFVPVTIYFGSIIANGGDLQMNLARNKSATETDNIKLYHASAGFSADLLAAILAGAVKLDLGVVFPLFGAATYQDPTKASGDYENQLNLALALYGDISDLGVEGLGLFYELVFALDTETKINALGDIDADNGDNLKELLKFTLTPSYTIGQFKPALEFVFGMVGEKAAAFDGSEAYNRFEITPSVTWSPSSIASVKGYFRYTEPNSKTDENEYMTLGLDYNATIGVEGF